MGTPPLRAHKVCLNRIPHVALLYSNSFHFIYKFCSRVTAVVRHQNSFDHYRMEMSVFRGNMLVAERRGRSCVDRKGVQGVCSHQKDGEATLSHLS